MTRYNTQLVTYRHGKFLDVLTNSALGLVDVYNLLQFVVDSENVKDFQGRLQDMLRIEAQNGDVLWPALFSPRLALWSHKLVAWRLYRDGNNNGSATDEIATNEVSNMCMNGWLSFGAGEYNK